MRSRYGGGGGLHDIHGTCTEGCVVVQWLALLSHSTKIPDFSRIIGVPVKVCDCLC